MDSEHIHSLCIVECVTFHFMMLSTFLVGTCTYISLNMPMNRNSTWLYPFHFIFNSKWIDCLEIVRSYQQLWLTVKLCQSYNMYNEQRSVEQNRTIALDWYWMYLVLFKFDTILIKSPPGFGIQGVVFG